MYKCGICGKDHAKLDDYVACVAKCGKQAKEEQQRVQYEKLEKERKGRFEKIQAKYNELKNDVQAFAVDYGYFPFSSRSAFYELSDLVNKLCK